MHVKELRSVKIHVEKRERDTLRKVFGLVVFLAVIAFLNYFLFDLLDTGNGRKAAVSRVSDFTYITKCPLDVCAALSCAHFNPLYRHFHYLPAHLSYVLSKKLPHRIFLQDNISLYLRTVSIFLRSS